MNSYSPVSHYLPHDPPMVLLDEVVDVTAETCHCRVAIHPNGVFAPFLSPTGELPAWFGLEIMAQTIAVWSGWHQRQGGAETIALGMLLGARKLTSRVSQFAAGSTLDIHVTLLAQNERFGGFEGKIYCRGEALSHAHLSTYQLGDQELQQIFGEN